MQILFLSKFFGWFFTVTGIGILLNPKQQGALFEELKQSRTTQFVMSIIPVILGAFLVSGIQNWDSLQARVITTFGWIFLLGGIFRTWFPELWIRLASKVLPFLHWAFIGTIVAMVGVYFLITGYYAAP